MKKIVLFLMFLLVTTTLSARAGSIIVIAHGHAPFSSLTADELQRIFLGKKAFWNGGRRIVPVCLKQGETHEAFLRTFMDMTGSQFDIFWRQAVFVGTGNPPKAFERESDLVEFVRNTPGGLGYIDSSTSHGELKIIKVK